MNVLSVLVDRLGLISARKARLTIEMASLVCCWLKLNPSLGHEEVGIASREMRQLTSAYWFSQITAIAVLLVATSDSHCPNLSHQRGRLGCSYMEETRAR